jgi:hypothetical protein
MIRIALTPAAYAAIAATLPGTVGVEPQRAPNADYFVWLDPAVVNRLAAMRGPGESYSDVIMRLMACSETRSGQRRRLAKRKFVDPYNLKR